LQLQVVINKWSTDPVDQSGTRAVYDSSAMPQELINTSPGPKRRGEVVVRRVLETTLQQLADVGYERLSVPEVAALAGLNKTSVYRRWPTKAALVREALQGSMGQPGDAPDTGSLRGDMMALTRFAMAFAQSPVGMGVLRVLLAEGFNPEVRGFANAMFSEQEAQGHVLVFKRAIQRGELSANADIPTAVSAVAGALMQRIFIEQLEANEAYLERLIDFVLFGLQGQRAQSKPARTAKTKS
jgi:AcrR family transcriptional regulator